MEKTEILVLFNERFGTIGLTTPLPDAETSLTSINIFKAFLPQLIVGTDGMEFKPVTICFTDGSKKLILESSRLTLADMRHWKHL